MQLLDHPNIVECKEVVENEKQMVIIMEWLRGGHLLDNLEEMAGQHYSEQQASVLFVQVRALWQTPLILLLLFCHHLCVKGFENKLGGHS